MNDIIKTQLDHRTIREFKNEPFPQETYVTLMEVARQTATSSGLQASSIIRITDPQLKQQIADICRQEYIARLPLLMIFIVDQYRNNQIALEQGIVGDGAAGMDGFFQSFTDACLMAQNVVNAAESMNLGTLYIGSILNNPPELCRLLNLPPLTFPVVGLGIGKPNALKPRMPMAFRTFENGYIKQTNMLGLLKDYDEMMQTYYDLRDTNRRLDSFTQQVAKRMVAHNPARQALMNVIVDQGFDLKLK